MISRLKSALLLTPAILLLLIWIASYGSGTTEISRLGMPMFLSLATATAVCIAYCITLYVAKLRRE